MTCWAGFLPSTACHCQLQPPTSQYDLLGGFLRPCNPQRPPTTHWGRSLCPTANYNAQRVSMTCSAVFLPSMSCHHRLRPQLAVGGLLFLFLSNTSPIDAQRVISTCWATSFLSATHNDPQRVVSTRWAVFFADSTLHDPYNHQRVIWTHWWVFLAPPPSYDIQQVITTRWGVFSLSGFFLRCLAHFIYC